LQLCEHAAPAAAERGEHHLGLVSEPHLQLLPQPRRRRSKRLGRRELACRRRRRRSSSGPALAPLAGAGGAAARRERRAARAGVVHEGAGGAEALQAGSSALVVFKSVDQVAAGAGKLVALWQLHAGRMGHGIRGGSGG
jgi:hypothetical protein